MTLDVEKLQQLVDEMTGALAGTVVKMSANEDTLKWLRTQFPEVLHAPYPPLTAMPLFVDNELPYSFVKMEYGSGRKEIVKICVEKEDL